MSRADRRVASAWAGGHVALLAVMVAGSFLLAVDRPLRHADAVRWLVERFTWWDSWHYVRIAEMGYLPPPGRRREGAPPC